MRAAVSRVRWAGVAGALSVLLTLCACQSGATPTTGISPSAPASPSSTPTVPHDASPTTAVGAPAVPLEVATEAVRAFCRPTLNRAAWIAALDGYLTLAAAGAYATVDPAGIPCHRVTSPAVAGVGDGYTQLVTVPTEVGGYLVMLERPSTTAPWLAYRIAPARAAR